MKHPNSFAAAVTAGLAAVILKVAKHYGYAHLSNEQALGYAASAIVVILFLGRRVWTVGLKGIVGGVWNGARKVTDGTQQPPPEPPAA